MQRVNESGDVERLLDVLGVPSLPYQSFRNSIDARLSRPARTASTRVETSFPLLVAALPELAGAIIPRPTDINQSGPAAERPPEDTPDDAVPPGHSPDVAAPPAIMPAPAPTAPATSALSTFHKPANASPVPTTQAPSRPAETPIRGVFNVLRGTPIRRETETTSQRGIRTLFHRP